MNRIVTALVGIAAMIIIGQFLWSFKTDADRVEAERQAKVDEIIKDRTTQAACSDAGWRQDHAIACARNDAKLAW